MIIHKDKVLGNSKEAFENEEIDKIIRAFKAGDLAAIQRDASQKRLRQCGVSWFNLTRFRARFAGCISEDKHSYYNSLGDQLRELLAAHDDFCEMKRFFIRLWVDLST